MNQVTENAHARRGAVPPDLTQDGGYLEYTKAANPIGSGTIPPIPIVQFSADLHASGPSRIIPLDISEALRCQSPASSASLLASFIRIRAGERLTTGNQATSHLLYAIQGTGSVNFGSECIPYRQGDLITLPCGPEPTYIADEESVFYWVNDEPLLRYLGVAPMVPRFRPTLYPREESRAALHEAAADAFAAQRSRVSVLLTNARFPQTLTITHVLWAMLGILPVGANQLPHSHKSVACGRTRKLDRPDSSSVGRGRCVHHPARLVAFASQRIWRSGVSDANPRRRFAYLSSNTRYSISSFESYVTKNARGPFSASGVCTFKIGIRRRTTVDRES